MSGRLEIYCSGTLSAPHERFVIALVVEHADDFLGRRWITDPEVRQYLHGDTYLSPHAPVDIRVERSGPLRARYSLRCDECRYALVRAAGPLEAVFAELIRHDIKDVALRRLAAMCC